MFRWRPIAAAVVVVVASLAAAASSSEVWSVRFPDELKRVTGLSAAAMIGNHLLIASDETTEVLVLERTGDKGSFKLGSSIQLPVSRKGEIDIEAIAANGNTIYVAGSHSLARKEPTKKRTHAENRARFQQIRHQRNRDHVFRFEFDPVSGAASNVAAISLRDLLFRNPILSRFTQIPSKENGVDIEGMSVVGEDLYLGFRSPVLRHGFVPILKTRFDAPETGELLFVDLGGRGIRDMASVRGGFLILAGPSGGAKERYSLYHWTGEDGLPGSDRSVDNVERLAKIDPPAGGKAEAITILKSKASCHDVLIVFDGIPGGSPRVERVCLSGPT